MSFKKIAKCECSSASSFTKEIAFDDDNRIIYEWRCNNCGHSKPIGKKKDLKRYSNGMTKQQMRTLEKLSEATWERATLGGKRADVMVIEMKLKLTEDGSVSFYVVYGSSSNPNNFLLHDRWSIFVGPRGGCIAYSFKYGKHKKLVGFNNCLIWGLNS